VIATMLLAVMLQRGMKYFSVYDVLLQMCRQRSRNQRKTANKNLLKT